MSHAHPELLGPATTDWNGFVGTAVADDLELSDTHRSLDQLAQPNPARWIIAAVDVIVGDRGATRSCALWTATRPVSRRGRICSRSPTPTVSCGCPPSSCPGPKA